MICNRCKLQINEDDDVCPYYGEPNKSHLKKDVVIKEETNENIPKQQYFFKAFIRMYKNYFNFKGTVGRAEYWSVQVILIAILIPFMSIYKGVEPENVILTTPQVWIINLTAFYLFVSFIPLIALGVRRLHDANLPGFLLLLNLVVGFGSLIVIVLLMFGHKNNIYDAKANKEELML